MPSEELINTRRRVLASFFFFEASHMEIELEPDFKPRCPVPGGQLESAVKNVRSSRVSTTNPFMFERKGSNEE